jgi:hypothetical protein
MRNQSGPLPRCGDSCAPQAPQNAPRGTTDPHTGQVTDGAGRGGDTDSLLIAESPVVLPRHQPLSSATTLNIE